MRPEKKETLKEKLLDRYFEQAEDQQPLKDAAYEEKSDFTYETASVVSEIAIVKEPTVISSETTIHGNVSAQNDLEISGQIIGDIVSEGFVMISGGSVTGNIKARKLFIKNSTINGNLDSEAMIDIVEGSEINGNITGGDIAINCKCKGTIIATQRLKLSELAVVNGDVQTKIIKIEEGAVVQGNFKMTL